MVLKQHSPITADDLCYDAVGHTVGWVLVAPHVVIRVHLYTPTEIAPDVDIYLVDNPLGPEYPLNYTRWCGTKKLFVRRPRKLQNRTIDWLKEVNQLANWSRSVTLKRLKQ